jgi:hypothetical protein
MAMARAAMTSDCGNNGTMADSSQLGGYATVRPAASRAEVGAFVRSFGTISSADDAPMTMASTAD